MDTLVPDDIRRRTTLREVAEPETAAIAFDMFGTLHLAPLPLTVGPDHAPLLAVARATAGALSRGVRSLRGAAAVVALAASGLAAPAGAQTLLNVSYDPTRELYREFNEAFNAHWQAEGHAALDIQVSHGGSGSQARAVIDGLEAQVVTLALAGDIDAIATNSDKLPKDWQSRLPHNSSPYTSTIVFLVREGNPKGIENWDNLVADGIQVITPNPKTSGGARWNYLAAWAFAQQRDGGDVEKTKEFVGKLFANVPVLDSGARGSTTTFVERGVGDVLLAWENEALLALKQLGEDQFDIVYPSLSILAEPAVALVDGNITSDEQRGAAQAYLEYLYSPEGQAIALRNFYRAWDTSAATPEELARFPELELVSITDFGGWAKVQQEHFGDGGVFDQIYVAK
jgi:sulfate transport system substrate-binding protein